MATFAHILLMAYFPENLKIPSSQRFHKCPEAKQGCRQEMSACSLICLRSTFYNLPRQKISVSERSFLPPQNFATMGRCPLYPQKRTFIGARRTSNVRKGPMISFDCFSSRQGFGACQRANVFFYFCSTSIFRTLDAQCPWWFEILFQRMSTRRISFCIGPRSLGSSGEGVAQNNHFASKAPFRPHLVISH